MKKLLPILVVLIAAALVAAWISTRGDPEASEPLELGARPTERSAPPPLESIGERGAAEPLRDSSAPVTEIPLESAGVEPPRDVAARASIAADSGLQVWTWRERVVKSERESGAVVLRIEPGPSGATRGASPTSEAPWRVRVWGVKTGDEPARLGEQQFDGQRPIDVEIAAADLERYDQVFVLRAGVKADPPRILAACARASFAVQDQVFECPKDAPRPYQLVAWWGLTAEGELARRVIELAPGRTQRVEARYAALFSIER